MLGTLWRSWARLMEVAVGVWLLCSPYVFGHPDNALWLWGTDWTCGILTIVFAGLSMTRSPRWAHVLTLGVVAWLVGFGYFGQPYFPKPPLENDLGIGVLLAMFVVLPTGNVQPPPKWREFNDSLRKSDTMKSGAEDSSPASTDRW